MSKLTKIATFWKEIQEQTAKFGRKYITNPADAPKGARIKKGKRGGYYYDEGQVGKSRSRQKAESKGTPESKGKPSAEKPKAEPEMPRKKSVGEEAQEKGENLEKNLKESSTLSEINSIINSKNPNKEMEKMKPDKLNDIINHINKRIETEEFPKETFKVLNDISNMAENILREKNKSIKKPESKVDSLVKEFKDGDLSDSDVRDILGAQAIDNIGDAKKWNEVSKEFERLYKIFRDKTGDYKD